MTQPLYTTQGKQILRDGRHFADAATLEAAAVILAALVGLAREAAG